MMVTKTDNVEEHLEQAASARQQPHAPLAQEQSGGRNVFLSERRAELAIIRSGAYRSHRDPIEGSARR
jgi:hypothetical protein